MINEITRICFCINPRKNLEIRENFINQHHKIASHGDWLLKTADIFLKLGYKRLIAIALLEISFCIIIFRWQANHGVIGRAT